MSPAEPRAQRACPECEKRVDARGLAGHRRLKHGVAGRGALAVPGGEESSGPAAAGPAADLDGIQRALGRIEARLIRLETAVEGLVGIRADVSQNGEAAELARIHRELEHLVQRIADEKSAAEAEAARRGGPPRTDEEVLAQTAFHQRLGRLNRRRYGLLFRLSEQEGGQRPDFSSFGMV